MTITAEPPVIEVIETPVRTDDTRTTITTETADTVVSAFNGDQLTKLKLIDTYGNPVIVSLAPSKNRPVTIMTTPSKSEFTFQQGDYTARVGGVKYVDHTSGEVKTFAGRIGYNTAAQTLGMFWFVSSTTPYMTMRVALT